MPDHLHFISGLENCHLPGLYSLIVSERESPEIGIRRVFYCGNNCLMDKVFDGADFRLKPHNHRQDIALTRLFGTPRNVRVEIGFGEHRLWCYAFGSALLNGEFTLERMSYENAQMHTAEITETPLRLHWSVGPLSIRSSRTQVARGW